MTNLSDVVQDERTARMVLSMIVEPDDAVTGRLLGELGALELLRLAERDDVVPGLSNVDAQVWRSQFERSDARTLEQNVVEAERAGIGALVPGDKEWPSALDDLGDRRPYVLWARGTTSFLARPLSDFVTITGARASTSYGDHVAGQLASDLANAERLVVAGGAYGIEGAAHRAALASGGDTIAVMANGADRMYPMGHRELLERVADLGLMVSEMPPGAVPTRHRFIARARLMAALSTATVVVEAGVRSGSMTDARRAHELGRAVGAVPGPVTSAASAGPHQLLRDGASLVTMPRTCSLHADVTAQARSGHLRLPAIQGGRQQPRSQ
ncbi:DNA processing protein [Kineosphaera limosa]|uniref:DNA processing protein n=1 Tax=Kineosphaera limosa NBRC 100340 TaxID=1184609 RepID=K6X940_9MICO|nr:DNA-processing protein DprA [Kineosphaera limosa]NYE02088.1 DNA processing protein [Kineosphaera limosa]GAB95309.1 DNA processing protein [Kineosphaera limosa NBRC 100340]